MERILKFEEFDRVDEGWIHNITLIGSIILANIPTLKGQDIQSGFDNKKAQIERMESSLSYAAMVGYLSEMPSKTIEEKAAIKEARIYFEHLRDDKTPQKLSDLAKGVVDFATEEAKKLTGQELYQLSEVGMGLLTKK